MNFREHVTEMEANDPAFREERERLRPEYEFRKALIGARIAAGLTQAQLAERLGTTQSAIARLEGGGRLPTVDTLYRLAQALNVNFTVAPDAPLTVRRRRRRGSIPPRPGKGAVA